MKPLTALASLMLLMPVLMPAKDVQAAPGKTELENQCGTLVAVAPAAADRSNVADRKAYENNAKVMACRKSLMESTMREAVIDGLSPKIIRYGKTGKSHVVGSYYPGLRVNGYPIRLCSHGGPCLFDMEAAMRRPAIGH